jgi:hypothetical protein
MEETRCTVCNTRLGTQMISPLGHEYKAVVTPPTTTAQGYTTRSCSRCGDKTVGDYVDPVGSVGLAYTVNPDGFTVTVTGIGSCTDSQLVIGATIDGYAVASSSISTDINEYGIIHLSDPEQVAEIERMAQVYVENQRDFLSTFLNTYNEAEMAKLEEMQVRVFGNYVVYTILSANDTAAVMNAIEEKLTKQ